MQLDRVEKLGIIFLDEIDKIAGERSQAGGARRFARRRAARSAADRRRLVRADQVRDGEDGSRPVHRRRRVSRLQAKRSDSRIAGPRPHSRGAQGAHRTGLHPDHDRAGKRADHDKQYAALVEADGAKLDFKPDGIAEIARIAALVNERMENIGARRLHTVMTTLLEDVLFELPDPRREDHHGDRRGREGPPEGHRRG